MRGPSSSNGTKGYDSRSIWEVSAKNLRKDGRAKSAKQLAKETLDAWRTLPALHELWD